VTGHLRDYPHKFIPTEDDKEICHSCGLRKGAVPHAVALSRVPLGLVISLILGMLTLVLGLYLFLSESSRVSNQVQNDLCKFTGVIANPNARHQLSTFFDCSTAVYNGDFVPPSTSRAPTQSAPAAPGKRHTTPPASSAPNPRETVTTRSYVEVPVPAPTPSAPQVIVNVPPPAVSVGAPPPVNVVVPPALPTPPVLNKLCSDLLAPACDLLR